MKIKYFHDTGTLYIELRAAKVAETNGMDKNGKICCITTEHAAEQIDLSNYSFGRIAA